MTSNRTAYDLETPSELVTDLKMQALDRRLDELTDLNCALGQLLLTSLDDDEEELGSCPLCGILDDHEDDEEE